MINVKCFLFKIIVTLTGMFSGLNTFELYENECLKSSSYNYIFKGSNPNNYILFNNEIWRIILVENGHLKIMRNTSLGKMAFDNEGINDWKNSSLNNFLNDDYYNSLSEEYKKIVKKYSWSVGSVYQNMESGRSIEKIRNEEKTVKWNGYVGLISMGDYIEANSNDKMCGNINLYFKNDETCYKTNYLNNYGNIVWTISKDDINDTSVFYVGGTYFGDSRAIDKYDIYPVLYLEKNIKLKGYGTKVNPFKIEK